MANSLSGKLKGGKYKQKLHFVPDADNEPKVGHGISEPAIFRFLLNEETHRKKFDEAAEVEIAKMLEILKDIDKHSKITQVEAYRSSMNLVTNAVKAFHVFIVFKSTKETANDGDYWWSLEKSTEYIFLQRSRNKENVKDKLKGEERTKVKLIEKDLKGKGTIKDLFEILWAHQIIPEKYNIYNSNCQFLVRFVGEQITEIGYKYKGNFPYSPPRESGRDKKMLELINAIRDCSDWSPLFHLIKMGNTDLVDKIVASGMYDINASCKEITPLHLAIRLKKTKMVQHLLQHPMNADPTKRDKRGRSALILAAGRHRMKEVGLEIIDLLLAHDKVNVDDVDGDGRTALHSAAAAYSSNVIAVQKLLDKGANPKILDKKGQSPLHLAAMNRDGIPIIDLLLAHDKVMIDHADENGLTALHLAARETNIGAVQKLLDNGANPNIFDKWGHSPLHLAATYDFHCKIINLLLAHGKVNLDNVDENGQTALHLAARESNAIAVQKLLEKGANPNIFDKEGRSPLYLAAAAWKRNDNKIMDLLLAHDKVNVDDVNAYGDTALHGAALTSNVIAVQKLIEKGANPKITNKWGQSPLHMAAKRETNGNEHWALWAACQRRGQSDGNEIMDLLLAHSEVKVDDVDGKGQTALHIAAYASNVIAVEYLINKGADPNAVVEKSGDTPLLMAARRENVNPIIDLLLEAQKVKGMGDVNDRNKQGRTALHYAAAYSNEITAEHLIIKGANVNRQANVGLTPLDMAALGAKNMNIIDLLLQNINEGDIQQYRNDKRLFFFARHNLHGLGETIFDRLVEKGIKPPCTETDHCTGEFDDEITDVNTRRFVDKVVDPSIDLTGFDGIDFLIARVKITLGIYDDINGRDPNGDTPLLVAIRANYVNVVRRLLERGADPTIRTVRPGNTPFHVAVRYDTDFDILNLLLESGKVDINETTEFFKETALHMAIENSNTATAEFLLSKGANPNVADEDGRTPLHVAAEYAKDMDIVELLLNHPDVDVNLLNNEGDSALIYAKYNRHRHGERIANRLKEKGVIERKNRLFKLNDEVESFRKLVIYTSSNAAYEIESVLSDATVPIEDKIARIKEENLISAIEDSDVERVRRLLKNGTDISRARGEHGMNALHVASKYAKTTDLIEFIRETGKFDINGVDNNGWTPLHWAINKSYYSKVNAGHLIRKGADPTIANKEGDTPLHLMAALYAKEIETINLILENEQVAINSRANNGMTALHYAIEARNEITARYLLEKGADPNAADENGATSLHLAAENEQKTELIDIILETGKCNINGVDNYGWTPLHYAIEGYFPATINARHLIQLGADPGIADENGVTPLHMAAENAYSMDLIDELLLKIKTGAVDVNCVDNEGRTPLACARDNKYGLGESIIDRLKEYGAKE